ncbi:MAG: ribosome silencing factor [Bacteroidales bacterium]|nr:ribosome silencing factor [Bacteroidales bacterium]
MPLKKQNESAELAEIIIEGILKKKGQEIVSMNLMKLKNSVSNFFIVCHGTSTVQTKAIAESVLEEVINEKHTKPWHKEGFENAEWILLDYVDVVVHIFLEDTRKFYNLESLWADAEIKEYNNK